MRRVLVTLSALALAVGAAACDVTPAVRDAGAYDALPPDLWDPGPKPTGPCGYGYGYDCPAAVVDCATETCVHGLCIRSDGGVDSCICDAGYAGLLCDSCAPGYQADGLTCVSSDPCAAGPCVYGTCYADPDGFTCSCDTGYAGTLCDTCAAGYHPQNLACVPD